jgi:glutaredoxin
MTSFVRRLLRRPDSTKAARLAFTVYSRAGCSCCDKAMKVLQYARRRFGFTIDLVDIDQDPELVAKYNTEVPVVTVNGKVRFRSVVNPELLERLLVAESRSSSAEENQQ